MSRSEFIEKVISQAQANPRTVVLPEGADPRVRDAARQIVAEKIARVVVLGGDDVRADLPEDVVVINPETSDKLQGYADLFCEMRKHKGMTPEKALEAVKHVNYFGMMMVDAGEADGLVSGAAHSTADTVRPALQIIKGARKGGMVSSLFFMVCDIIGILFFVTHCARYNNDPKINCTSTLSVYLILVFVCFISRSYFQIELFPHKFFQNTKLFCNY